MILKEFEHYIFFKLSKGKGKRRFV